MQHTLDAALLCRSRAGSNLGHESRLVEELYSFGIVNIAGPLLGVIIITATVPCKHFCLKRDSNSGPSG